MISVKPAENPITTNQMQELGKVLLVDDDSTNNFLSARTLYQTKSIDKVFEAEDGHKALELVKKEKLDLILLDVNMPGMNGFEFLEALQQLQNESDFVVPVIVLLTTTEDYLDCERITQYPLVKGMLTKPLAGDHMNYLIGLVIDEKRTFSAA